MGTRLAAVIWLTWWAATSHAAESRPEAAAAPGVGPECRVSTVGGAPAFVVDGKPHPGLSYMTYANNYPVWKDKPALPQYVKLFAEAGCDLYTFVIDLGGLYRYTDSIWPEPEKWDFAQPDAIARMILGAAPPQAKLVLQLYVDAPEWWGRAHPDDLFRLADGTTDFGSKLFALPRSGNLASIASQRWRADMRRAIKTFIDHVEASDYGQRVIGYQVCGQKTEEWYHWSMNTQALGDYSAPMQAAFGEWLRARYATDARLQEAWHLPDATLAGARIPGQAERYGDRKATFRDPTREAHVLDFHRFWSDVMAETIAYFACVVKEKTGRRKAVGAFYAYTFEFAELGEDAGHLALHRLLDCPDLDFIMAPSSYHRRDLKGGQSCFRAPVLSLVQHGKMLWNDFDPASFKFYEKDQKVFGQWKPWVAVTDTAEEYTWMIRRELGNALANGVNMAHFDHHGGYYDDPLIVAEVARARRIREEALGRDRSSCAQILLVVDEDSPHYLSFRNPISTPILSGQLAEMPFVAPYDAVLLSDLERIDTRRYRLALVLNAFKLEPAQRQTLARRLEGGGRCIVWLYAPGYFASPTGPPDVAASAGVTGMRVASRPRPAGGEAVRFESPAAGSPLPDVPLLAGEQFVVTDPAARVLARRTDAAHEAAVASQTMDGWTSVYSATAPLPRGFLRQLAAEAGVHLYHDSSEDQVYANRSYLTLVAGPTLGPRTLRLPRKTDVTDLNTDTPVCAAVETYTLTLKPWEARILGLQPPQAVDVEALDPAAEGPGRQ
jgi:beta-galactosidase